MKSFLAQNADKLLSTVKNIMKESENLDQEFANHIKN